jgi:hypothetical protein
MADIEDMAIIMDMAIMDMDMDIMEAIAVG